MLVWFFQEGQTDTAGRTRQGGHGRTDGRTDGRMEGRTEGWTEGNQGRKTKGRNTRKENKEGNQGRKTNGRKKTQGKKGRKNRKEKQEVTKNSLTYVYIHIV